MKTILAIDPGRDKCGLAVVSNEGTLHKEVVLLEEVAKAAEVLITKYTVEQIIIGNGTGANALIQNLSTIAPTISVEVVEEAFTSQRARVRFLEDNQPKGIRRLIPRGLLTPDRPYDDYVAVILAEDYLEKNRD